MNFYTAMNPISECKQAVAVAKDESEKPMADKSNFLTYQFDSKESSREAQPIPPGQQPAPKKLKDAISKRVDSPATRYINMINS